MKTGEKITVIISIIAIVFSVGCVILNQNLIEQANQQQQENYQHNVAQALYFDINILQIRFENTPSPVNHTTFLAMSVDEQPYYTSNGLYYVFSKDIANFNDPILSSELYDYYNVVTLIENERNFIEETTGGCGVTYQNTPMSSEKLLYTSDAMQTNLQIANEESKVILQKLKQEYNLSEPQPISYAAESCSFDLNI